MEHTLKIVFLDEHWLYIHAGDIRANLATDFQSYQANPKKQAEQTSISSS